MKHEKKCPDWRYEQLHTWWRLISFKVGPFCLDTISRDYSIPGSTHHTIFKSCCTMLHLIIFTSPTYLPFTVFLIWKWVTILLKKFLSASAHCRKWKGSYPVLLLAAVAWTSLTHTSCPHLQLKFLCMSQKKFLVPQQLP